MIRFAPALVAAFVASAPALAHDDDHDRGRSHGKGYAKGHEKTKVVVIERRPNLVIVDPQTVAPVLVPAAVPMAGGVMGLNCNRELMGSILGAGVGGLAGSQIGSGNGQLAATAAGTVIGFLVGGSVGRSMDEVDRACAGQALERLPINHVATWQTGGTLYELKPVRVFSQRGLACREFVTTAIVGGRPSEVVSQACRQRDGSWLMLGA